jgi:hypothetical protein
MNQAGLPGLLYEWIVSVAQLLKGPYSLARCARVHGKALFINDILLWVDMSFMTRFHRSVPQSKQFG